MEAILSASERSFPSCTIKHNVMPQAIAFRPRGLYLPSFRPGVGYIRPRAPDLRKAVSSYHAISRLEHADELTLFMYI